MYKISNTNCVICDKPVYYIDGFYYELMHVVSRSSKRSIQAHVGPDQMEARFIWHICKDIDDDSTSD